VAADPEQGVNRIVFNGEEYASRDAMPEEVRRAYDEALAMLRDAGIAGRGGPSDDHTVVTRTTSIKFEGTEREALPEPVRRLVDSALGTGGGGTGDPGVAPGSNPLHTPMGMMLAFLAGFILVFAIGLMFALGGGPSRLPGRLAIAVAALLLLGWLDGMATRLARSRESLLGPDSPGYRRFVVWSAAGLATAAVLLLGLAWYMP
jgi:hypothetical protein